MGKNEFGVVASWKLMNGIILNENQEREKCEFCRTENKRENQREILGAIAEQDITRTHHKGAFLA